MHSELQGFQAALGHQPHDTADVTLAYTTQSHGIHSMCISEAVWTLLYVVLAALSGRHQLLHGFYMALEKKPGWNK